MKTAPNTVKMYQELGQYDHDFIRLMWKSFRRPQIIEYLEDIAKIRLHSTADLNYCRKLCINHLLEMHGVEYLGKNKLGQNVDYLNSGDCYVPTLFFVGDRMFISTVGDLVERGYIKEEKR